MVEHTLGSRVNNSTWPLACFYLLWNCLFYSWQLLVLLYFLLLAMLRQRQWTLWTNVSAVRVLTTYFYGTIGQVYILNWPTFRPRRPFLPSCTDLPSSYCGHGPVVFRRTDLSQQSQLNAYSSLPYCCWPGTLNTTRGRRRALLPHSLPISWSSE